MRKTLQKLSTILLCAYCATAEPQLPTKEYLPPQEGYNYGAPSIPFQSSQPTYRPPPPPPPPAPIYSTPAPIYSTPAPFYSTPRPYNPPKPSYGTPFESGSAISPVGQEGAGTGGGEFDHLRQPHVPGMPFDFAYAVKDDYYGNDFGHQATSNGDQVRGEYRTLLPDGRLQIVKYIADWKDGYTADVSYQGEAKYPQQQSAGGASGGSISGASQSISGNYGPYAPAGYRPSVPFPQSSPPASYYQPPKTNFLKPSFTGPQPGPAIPSAYPALSSPRPSAGYSQQPVSGYGANANQPSSGSYPSSPAPTYPSPTGDYGNYKK